MAVNPITSESLTVDFKSLMKIPVGDRMKAANINPDFLQSILSALTPIQIANAFPSYYKRQLPDVSNFITSYITSRNGGNFNQTGGGDGGYSTGYYDQGNNVKGSARPAGSELSVEEMKKKLLEKGIDVDGIYNAVGQNGISEDDPSMKAVKGMTDEKLADAGLQRITKPDGSTIIIQKLSEVSAMTDQEVSNRISGKFVAKDNATEKQRAVIEFANRWNISPQAAAGVLKIESGVSSDIAGGASGNYHGVFQLQTEQIAGLTKKAGFGALTPEQYRKLSIDDQLKVMDEYYKQAGITPEFFTGDPKTDASKMWALQLAPGNAKSIDYTDPNAVISNTKQAAIIRQGGIGAVTVGSAGEGSVSGGQEFLGESYERIEGNATPEQISKARVQLAKEEQLKRKDALTKNLFNAPSPTSSAYIQAPFDDRTVTVLHGQTDTFASRSSQGVVAAGIDNIDPRLVTLGDASIRAFEKMNPGYTVRVISGKRTEATNSGSPTSRHLRGGAVDYEIVDPDGNVLPNLGGGNSGVRAEAGFYAPKYEELGRYMEAARLKLAKDDPRYAENQVVAGMHFGGNWWMDSMHMQLGGKGALGDLYSGFKSPEQLRKEGQPEVIVKAVENAISAGATHSINEEEMQQLSDFLYSEGKAPIEVIQKVNPTVAEKLQKEMEQKQEKSAEQVDVASATPAETPVPQFALGGNIYGPNEDITLVDNATGNPIAQVGQNEKLEKKGNALQVTSETKLKAEELTNKYDSSTEMEDRMSNIEDSIQNQTQQPVTNQVVQKAREPERVQQETPQRWRESIAMAERPVSPSFNRAMARSKFFAEGHHFNRSAPSSQS